MWAGLWVITQLKLRDDATSFFTLGEGWGERGLKSCVVEKYFITTQHNSSQHTTVQHTVHFMLSVPAGSFFLFLLRKMRWDSNCSVTPLKRQNKWKNNSEHPSAFQCNKKEKISEDFRRCLNEKFRSKKCVRKLGSGTLHRKVENFVLIRLNTLSEI